ncbi:NUDIX hydrolase [Haloarchaeobius amylolyticus]|uniref:NUDIX hydrolase n=1 Tax=Haloarchaeobius amylolyticus TaxID=1198296 RepID=UPI00226E94FE|nr:NUDIX hydrolase [Haloarchaeobius amylolyticus]
MADADDIDARIDALAAEYGDVPVETAVTDLSDSQYQRARRLHDRGVPGAARVWVERDDEALLVREQSRPDSWGVPGGLIDPGESAPAAGEREVREETGVECTIVDVSYVYRVTRRHAEGEAPSFEEFAVAFVAEYVRGEPTRQPEEISEVAWWDTLPASVHSPADRLWNERFG